jgi:hypothetical protein
MDEQSWKEIGGWRKLEGDRLMEKVGRREMD